MIPNMSFLKGIVVVASLTAGSAMLMWLGERITEKGNWKWYFPFVLTNQYRVQDPE